MKRFLLILILTLPLFSFAKQKKRVACIDCYSTASLMPAFLEELGTEVEVEWILVQTHPYKEHHEIAFTGFPEGSLRLPYDLRNAGEKERMIAKLKTLNLDYVVGGMDEGTYQACDINNALGFTRDNPASSREIRNKKSLANKANEKFAIPTHILTEDIGAALSFVDGFPQEEVVVKWDSGAGGVDMLFLDKLDRQGLLSAFQERLRTEQRPFHGRKDQVLIEPRIDIQREFYINTFTFNGETVITGLWEYFKVKIGKYVVYFVDRPLDLLGPEAAMLRPIASEINANMEQRNGMSHMEVAIERGTGRVYLIENNTRVAGSGIPALERKLWGLSQLDLFLLSLFDQERMRREMAKFREGKPMEGDALLFMMPSPMQGVLTDFAVDKIKGLSTYVQPGEQYELKKNTKTKVTENLHGAATVVRLYGSTTKIRAEFEDLFDALTANQLIAANPSHSCAVQIASHDAFFRPFKDRKPQITWGVAP